MGFPEYASFDGLGLAALVREGKISPWELVDEALSRMDRVDSTLRAIALRMGGEALASLESLPRGAPFAGVPFLLKDLGAAYAGVPLTEGSRLFQDFIPQVDAELVRRYKAAGLVIVGKTRLPEFALRPVCESDAHGATSTPWMPGRTSGGSSGGAAAAVAAGIVPLAHGGDGGGSLRIPASCCGLFGFKPSRGRMPAGPGTSEQWWGYAAEHAITRSVRDSAALLDATHGAEAHDTYDLPRPARPFLDETRLPPRPLRVLLTKQAFFPGVVHPDCAAAADRTAKRLADLGHSVEEEALPMDSLSVGRDFFLVVCMEAAMGLQLARTRLGRKARKSEVEAGTWLCAVLGRQARATDWSAARARLQALTRRVCQVFERYDVLLCPTLALPPVPHGALSPSAFERTFQKLVVALNLNFLLRLPGVVEKSVAQVYRFMAFTPLGNITGQPSMSVPLDWNDEGLPIGSMLTGRLGDEATLFQLAAQLEAAHPWADRRPPVHSDLAQ